MDFICLIFVCLISLPLENSMTPISLSRVNLLRTFAFTGSNPSPKDRQVMTQEVVNGMRPPPRLSEGHLLV